MAPSYSNVTFSPAELSYLHTSLIQEPPIRPDGRTPTEFRPLIAETDILPSTNGSARVCFADGTEALVGVKAEVEKAAVRGGLIQGQHAQDQQEDEMVLDEPERGHESWLELSIEIPGVRDDDALPLFLSSMLAEALLADGCLKDRLRINRRFHWRLYVDILLISQPLSYPLPLLSLTTHLALLDTRLPALVSEDDEDPLFNDDWDAASFLYPRKPMQSTDQSASARHHKPPITLLVMTAGQSIIFDPSKEELAVADSVLALSFVEAQAPEPTSGSPLRLVALRTIDPPSRLTGAGVPNSLTAEPAGAPSTNAAPTPAAVTQSGGTSEAALQILREKDANQTVWRPPRGGLSRSLLARVIKTALEKGGVAEEVLEGLKGFAG